MDCGWRRMANEVGKPLGSKHWVSWEILEWRSAIAYPGRIVKDMG